MAYLIIRPRRFSLSSSDRPGCSGSGPSGDHPQRSSRTLPSTDQVEAARVGCYTQSWYRASGKRTRGFAHSRTAARAFQSAEDCLRWSMRLHERVILFGRGRESHACVVGRESCASCRRCAGALCRPPRPLPGLNAGGCAAARSRSGARPEYCKSAALINRVRTNLARERPLSRPARHFP